MNRTTTDRESKIDYYSISIAEEICSLPSFSPTKIAVMIKTRTKLLLADVLKDQVSALEDKRSAIITELADHSISGHRKVMLQNELCKINVELKKANKVCSHLKIAREYELLKKLCKEALPEKFMEDFYAQQISTRV